MPEFKDVAEAKKAMLEVFTALQGNKTEIEAAVTAAGDDLQKKMMTVIPLLQNTLAGPLATYGFPAGGPGACRPGVSALRAPALGGAEPGVVSHIVYSAHRTAQNLPCTSRTGPVRRAVFLQVSWRASARSRRRRSRRVSRRS